MKAGEKAGTGEMVQQEQQRQQQQQQQAGDGPKATGRSPRSRSGKEQPRGVAPQCSSPARATPRRAPAPCDAERIQRYAARQGESRRRAHRRRPDRAFGTLTQICRNTSGRSSSARGPTRVHVGVGYVRRRRNEVGPGRGHGRGGHLDAAEQMRMHGAPSLTEERKCRRCRRNAPSASRTRYSVRRARSRLATHTCRRAAVRQRGPERRLTLTTAFSTRPSTARTRPSSGVALRLPRRRGRGEHRPGPVVGSEGRSEDDGGLGSSRGWRWT